MAVVTVGIKNVVYTHSFDTPVGTLHCCVDKQGRVLYVGYVAAPLSSSEVTVSENKYACGELEYQLAAYFAGELTEFTLELRLDGTTFQKAVWSRILRIQYGQTMSYGEIAQKIGRKDAARAVGNAVAANPVAIVVPCHRVIPQSGGVGSYSARLATEDSGARTKRYLLDMEARVTSSQTSEATG